MNSRYEKLKKKENSINSKTNTSGQTNYRKKYQQIRKKIFLKAEALVWIVASFLIYDRTNFLKNLLLNKKCNQLFLKINLLSTWAGITIILYATVILPLLKKDSEKLTNKLVILTNFFMIFAFLSCFVTIFPVFRWWTLVMIPVQCMGLLMLGHFIPFNGMLNTLLTYFVLILVFLYGYFK